MKNGWKLGVFLIALFFMVATVTAGTVISGYEGSNICQNPNTDIFIGFEDGTDLTPITTQYSGVLFSGTTPEAVWKYGDVIGGSWNYPFYWTNGNFWASLENAYGVSGATGRMDFPSGASYVSILVASNSPVTMEAYDAAGNLLDTAGPTSINTGTETMDQLTVEHSGIAYVLIHDTGQYWTMDDVCVGPEGTNVPEFPSVALPVGMILGIAFLVYSLKTRNE